MTGQCLEHPTAAGRKLARACGPAERAGFEWIATTGRACAACRLGSGGPCCVSGRSAALIRVCPGVVPGRAGRGGACGSIGGFSRGARRRGRRRRYLVRRLCRRGSGPASQACSGGCRPIATDGPTSGVWAAWPVTGVATRALCRNPGVMSDMCAGSMCDLTHSRVWRVGARFAPFISRLGGRHPDSGRPARAPPRQWIVRRLAGPARISVRPAAAGRRRRPYRPVLADFGEAWFPGGPGVFRVGLRDGVPGASGNRRPSSILV